MNRHILFFSLLLLSLDVLSEDRVCWEEYAYKGESSGPGGHGSSSMTKDAHEAFVYKLCKDKCYSELPDYENISGIKSCTLDGIDIEDSPYKRMYLENKNKICHVKVAEKSFFKLYLVENKEQCEKSMKDYYWCKKGYECIFTFGQW